MIKGDVIFCASAITDGEIVDGVKDLGDKYEVSTFALHKDFKIFKKIKFSFEIMNDLSLSGKKWVYKKFDQSYVNFLKENYSLDEITAKLLSIRNIDKKYINSFLKPSIKNLIPNPNTLRDMEKTTSRIYQAINKKKKLVYLEIMTLMALAPLRYWVITSKLLNKILKFIFQIDSQRAMDLQ